MTYQEKKLLEVFVKQGIVYGEDLSKTEMNALQSLIKQNKVQQRFGSWSGLVCYQLVTSICSKCKQVLPHK